MSNEISSEEFTYRAAVISGLAEVTTLVKSIDGRMGELNRQVISQAERIAALERGAAMQTAADKATADGWKRIAPVIWVGIAMIAALALGATTKDILKIFAH